MYHPFPFQSKTLPARGGALGLRDATQRDPVPRAGRARTARRDLARLRPLRTPCLRTAVKQSPLNYQM